MNKLKQFQDYEQADTGVRPGDVQIIEATRYDSPSLTLHPRVRFLEGFKKPSVPKLKSQPEDVDLVAAIELDSSAVEQRFVEPAVWRPDPEPVREVFLALQRWEGIVTECRGNSFIARLTDLTADGPLEEVELSLEDVPPDDLSLVEIGAVFYWSIGYRDVSSGQRWRASTLRFRRLPVWSDSELKAAQERALEVAKVFGGN